MEVRRYGIEERGRRLAAGISAGSQFVDHLESSELESTCWTAPSMASKMGLSS